jgi:hypothetical protein
VTEAAVPSGPSVTSIAAAVLDLADERVGIGLLAEAGMA